MHYTIPGVDIACNLPLFRQNDLINSKDAIRVDSLFIIPFLFGDCASAGTS